MDLFEGDALLAAAVKEITEWRAPQKVCGVMDPIKLWPRHGSKRKKGWMEGLDIGCIQEKLWHKQQKL
jgi:hypothetical protein